MKKGQIAFLNFVILLVILFIISMAVAPMMKPFIDDGVAANTDPTQTFIIKTAIACLIGFVLLISVKAIRDRQFLGG